MRLSVPPLGCWHSATYILVMTIFFSPRIVGRSLAAPRRAISAMVMLVLAASWPGPAAHADQRDPARPAVRRITAHGKLARGTDNRCRIWLRWTAFADEADRDNQARSLMAAGMQMMGDGRLEAAERVFTEIVGAIRNMRSWNKRTVRFMRAMTPDHRDIAR